MGVILKAENVSKQYRLGVVGTGTLSHDLNRFWARIRGKEDPYLKVGAVNDRATKADSQYVWALKDINFEVQQGEILGIIGKNGAGKSTLLKLLSRVTSPTTGTIKTKGTIASLLEVGTGFHPELTGRENVYLNGAILGMRKAEIAAKIDEIVEFSGCEKYIDTPVKRYSSGMRVRLAFAVAAHLEPDILVVDEVLAVGDAEFQKKAIGKMQDISQGEGRTVLFVSHNMAAVKNLCTRGIVLEQGTIVFEGNQHDAVDSYLSSKNSQIDLSKRKDREGNQKLRVSKIEFLNANNKSINEIISGETLKTKITLQKLEPIDDSTLIIAVNYFDGQNNKVLTYVSDETGAKFTNVLKEGCFTLEIPNLYLRKGLYSLRILITEKTTNREDFVDLIENAAEINVLPGDLWKVGKQNRGGSIAVMPGNFIVGN